MDSLESERSPFFTQLQKEGQRAADLVFADLDTTTSSVEPGPFRTSQIKTLYATLPLFVLSHIIVTATFFSIASEKLQSPITTWWFGLSMVPVILLIILWSRHDRRKKPC